MGSFALAAGASGVREIADADADADSDALDGADGFVWEHFELGPEEPLPQRREATIPEVVAQALQATETRPRCDQFGKGALVNIRGPAAPEAPGHDRLVSIRIWAQQSRAVTVGRRRLAAVSAVEQMMRAGELKDPGDLVSAFARRITAELDPLIAELGDHIDDCETQMQEEGIYRLRRRIARARADAIAYRRFIAPDRDALTTLAGLPMDWLADDDRLHIRESGDRFARMAEELETIRERSALLHEQVSDLRSELVDQRSLSIAMVAFIFLPLTFVTGLLGMNVEGIPYAHSPWSFWGVVIFCVLLGLGVLGWFTTKHWLQR